ncbi:carbonic anhydrase [Acaryochloris sp. IP29b_bin.137]|uniref:carbonic anhydrase n=1 Tax=Acaryochloris sp. IP29b_bin.137 TaxID=2969217 RepID=UPI0026290F2B|nr:carbonic anhydrase [Acaryochloris sp. IP29b_bin.137]
MKKLVRGLQEFKQKYVAQHQELLKELSHGQKPRVLFISCSDSRVDPNLITQTDVGELFVIRNAGNIVPPYGAANGGEGGTIEYAIAALEIEQVVICGHSHCGAMTGLMKLNKLQADMPLVYDWLQHAETTRRVVSENYPESQGEERVEILVAENVLVQIDNLKTYPIVRSRMLQGKLQIYGWIYHIETGEVLAYDEKTHTYIPPQSQLLEKTPSLPSRLEQYLISTHAPPVACELPAPRLQSASSTPSITPVNGTTTTNRIRSQLDALLKASPDSWTDVDDSMHSMSKLLEDAQHEGMSANEAQNYHHQFSEQIPKWLRQME